MATSRSVLIRLGLDSTGFNRGIDQAKAKTKDFADQGEKAFRTNRDAFDRVADSAMSVGAVVGVGLGAATKAAIEWESAWAGVSKTVDGTPQQMADLERELRGLATTLPATHEEVAGIAEAAGQLGVARGDIAGFTRVMVDLSETTNLTADEAATSIAQLMNVMGTAPDQVDELGSTLVALGNSGASTERDIIQMAQRIAGAGELVGASEGEVLGLSSALASMGVSAELGGGVASRVLQDLYSAVETGGEGLDEFARIAGTSGEEFAAAFGADPVRALASFADGLNGVEASGGNVVATLSDLGFKSAEEQRILLQLKSANDLVTDSLDIQGQAWEANTALAREAATRYETDASKIQVAQNRLKDAAIDAGASLAPVFVSAAESTADMASAFGDLDPQVQGFIAKSGLVVAGVGLVGGGMLKAATSGVELYSSFKELREISGPTAGKVEAVGKAAAGLGIAAAAVTGIYALSDALDKDLTRSLEDTTGALLDYAAGKNALEGSFEIGNELITVDEALTRVGRNSTLDQWDSKVFSAFGSSQGVLNQLEAQFGAIDQSLNSLVSSGATDEAADSFRRLAESAAAQQIPAERLVELFPEYAAQVRAAAQASGEKLTSDEQLVDMMTGRLSPALQSVDASAQGAATGVGTAGQSMEDAGASAEAAAEETQKLIDNFTILRDGALSVERANIGWEESLDTLAAGTKEARKAAEAKALADGESEEAARAAADAELAGATAMDTSTEAGRTSRETVLDAVAALNEKVTADYQATASTGDMEKAERDAARALREGREDILDNAEAAGVNREKVDDLTEAVLKTPDQLKVETTTPGMRDAREGVRGLDEDINNVDGKSVTVSVDYKVSSSGKVTVGGKNVGTAFASGGHVRGPGTDTSDDIPALLSNDEFVVKAKSARLIGYDRLEWMNRHGDLPAFADGGRVSRDLDVLFRTSEAPSVDTSVDRFTSKVAGAVGDALEKALPDNIGGNNPVPLGSGDLVSFKGHRFTENFANRLQKVEDVVGSLAITQGGFRPRTPYSGTSHEGDAVDIAYPRAAIWQTMRRFGIAAWDRTGKGNWIPHIHGVPLPGAGRAAGSAVWQAQDYLAGGDGLAAGGFVRGPGGPTDDMVPIWGSNGEFMLREKAAKVIGPDLLHALNGLGGGSQVVDAAGLANGGFVRYSGVDNDQIVRLIRAIERPIYDLAWQTKKVADLRKAEALEIRKKDQARRAVDGTKGDARARAWENYDKQADRAKAATDRLRQSQEELAQRQQAIADTARQAAGGFRDLYSSQSTDVRDWIELMRGGTKDLSAFQGQVERLRKAGLSEGLLQQIVGMGAVAGGDVATQLLGSKTILTDLNKASGSLQDAADKLGLLVSTGQGQNRYATGGLLSGAGTGTSDSMLIRASTGEYVVNARSTAQNLPLLHAINYGDRPAPRQYTANYAAGGYVSGGPHIDSAAIDRIVDAIVANGGGNDFRNAQFGYDPREVTRRINEQRKDRQVMSGVRRGR